MAFASRIGPVEFVSTQADGKLVINNDVIRDLKKMKDKKVIAVAIAGEARKGKSFLMNRLMDSNAGFPLGSTVKSETKGIWISVLSHPNREDTALILLDTEGLSDPMKSDATHDAWIFTLAILLSSTFVYNSQGSIDQKAIDNLKLAAEMTKHIKARKGIDEEQGESFAQIFPELIWVVRDFFLELKNNHGEVMKPNDYLEDSLKLKRGYTTEVSETNRLKGALSDFFAKKNCFVFPRPVPDDARMRRLNELKEEDLDENFLESSKLFVDCVLNQTKNKTIEGKDISVAFFASLAEECVCLIQKGIICIESAVDAVRISNNIRVKEDALDLFGQASKIELPISLEMLRDLLKTAHNEAREYYLEHAFGPTKEATDEFLELLLKKAGELEGENVKLWEDFCQRAIDQAYCFIGTKIIRGDYMRSGGHRMLTEDIETLKEAYWNNPKVTRLQHVAEIAFKCFMDEKVAPHLTTVLMSDKSLSEKDQELEAADQKRQMVERQNELHRQAEEMLKAKVESIERQRKEDEERIREEQKKELEGMTKKHEELLKEQKRFHEEGNERLAKQREEESERWKKQMEDLIANLHKKEKKQRRNDFCFELAGKSIPIVLQCLVNMMPQGGSGLLDLIRETTKKTDNNT